MSDLIVVTNWEEVEKGSFYLSDDWMREVGKETIQKARKLQKEGDLFYAYIVGAKDFAIYGQMDSNEIFIDRDMNEVMSCETQVIDTEFTDRWEHEGY